jgi:hypothetical protein
MSIAPVKVSSGIKESLVNLRRHIIVLAFAAVHDECHEWCYSLLVIACVRVASANAPLKYLGRIETLSLHKRMDRLEQGGGFPKYLLIWIHASK